jgi:hypothetical protein
MSNLNRYEHTQHAPLYLLLCAVAAVCWTVGWTMRAEQPMGSAFFAIGSVMILIAAAFQHLTVRDAGDRLLISFGPLPLFSRDISYAEIVDFEPARTHLLDGWGIHFSLRRGWVWNLWGRDAVLLTLRHGRLCIGTDDRDGLIAFLRRRTSREPSHP